MERQGWGQAAGVCGSHRARDGAALRKLCGRPAAIITFLEGMWPRRILPHHCAGLGTALAELHVAGASFDMQRKNDLSVTDWRPLYESCANRAPEVSKSLPGIVGPEIDFLEANWPTGLPSGVCHADLFPDNVFFLGDKLSGMIDFYFACNDFFAYDLGICRNAWCFERDGSFNVTKAQLMLSNYRKVRDFSDAELQALPLLARAAETPARAAGARCFAIRASRRNCRAVRRKRPTTAWKCLPRFTHWKR